MKKPSFLSLADCSAGEVTAILDAAREIKGKGRGALDSPILQNTTGILVFRKPSLRTRLSFEVGIAQLGGRTVYLGSDEIGLGTREPTTDIARVLGSMGDFIVGRVFDHATLETFAAESGVPVINGLSDKEHPCQTLADILTIEEIKGPIQHLTVAYVGDAANNVARSLVQAAGILGFTLRIAAPDGYQPDEDLVRAVSSQTDLTVTTEPAVAVEGADVVYTDTWVSMGQEAEKEERLSLFAPYTVTADLMKKAHAQAIFMHDMPAYRGYEVEVDVIDGLQSVIYHQAENRLHAQKGLLYWLFTYGTD